MWKRKKKRRRKDSDNVAVRKRERRNTRLMEQEVRIPPQRHTRAKTTAEKGVPLVVFTSRFFIQMKDFISSAVSRINTLKTLTPVRGL